MNSKEKKKEKIFIEFNSNITNSDSNQKDILLEPSDITQLNGLIPKKNKINNKRKRKQKEKENRKQKKGKKKNKRRNRKKKKETKIKRKQETEKRKIWV